jgi:hypothetical protein
MCFSQLQHRKWASIRTETLKTLFHKSVGREGLRDLLHLNPIEFTDENEVLAELPKRLEQWKSLKPSGIELQLISKALGQRLDS